jgi:hypothetical protein
MSCRISEMGAESCTGMGLGVDIMILDGLRGVLISSGGLLGYPRDIRRCGSEKKPLVEEFH